MTEAKPYVYRLTHKVTGEFYHGVRVANKKPASEDLFVSYFSSSNTVRSKGFDCSKDACEFEQEMIHTHWNNELSLNKCKMSSTRSHALIFNNKGRKFTNEHRARISESNKGKHQNNRASDPDVRRKNSNANTGRIVRPETREKIRSALLGHNVTREQCAKKVAAQRAKNGGHYFDDSARLKLAEARKNSARRVLVLGVEYSSAVPYHQIATKIRSDKFEDYQYVS